MNLKDEATYLNSQTNSVCQVTPAFLAKTAGFVQFDSTINGHDRTTMPKLYDIPQVIIDKYFIKYNKNHPYIKVTNFFSNYSKGIAFSLYF